METWDVLILTSEWWDEGERHELRFYGKSSELGAVELIFDTVQPLFFVDRQEKLPALDYPIERKPVALTSFSGRPVDALYFRTQKELRQASDRFQATGVRHYEADVYPCDRFLMERFITNQALIAGESEKNGALTTFRNPKIKPGKAEPDLVIASIDIETGVKSGRLYSIAVHLSGAGAEQKRVFMLAESSQELPEDLFLYPDESSLMRAFLAWFKRADPDLIIGWHVIGFDLMFLENKCRGLGLALDLARNGRKIVLSERPGSGWFATISGRIVIDGPPALRGSGHGFSNYKLETVSQELLQTGKLITPDQNKIAEIERLFRENKPQLARYNLEDCVLVTRVLEKTRLIPIMFERSRISGLLIDQINIAAASLDHYYLPMLHRKGMVAPNAELSEKGMAEVKPMEIPSRPGIYQYVAELDFGHLFASLIHAFKIDPLARIKAGANSLETPGGYRFSAGEHILPEWMATLNRRRAETEKAGDRTGLDALDLHLNAICKVLGRKTCRFFHGDLLSALNSGAQWLLNLTRETLEAEGYQAIRIDGESVFLQLKTEERGSPQASARQIARTLSTSLQQRLEKKFGAAALTITARDYFRKFVLPQTRAGDDPAKQRYAGISLYENHPVLKVIGMEPLLANWTGLAKAFQTELYQAFFKQDGFEDWLRDYVERLKRGAFDDRLAYQKRIKKDVSEYAKNAPPHIKAARMLDKPGREIRYLWTRRGPYPAELHPSDIDHEHYIQKQLQPLADALLNLQNQTLTDITEPKQLGLF